ncbi:MULTISPECIES: ABC transporter permease [Microbacterium]|uniref:ABC transporter permease subunit n=1 Tax=Microbacterium mcarthurae TaxID=3035918 RepID=A0ABW9GCE9_9MICO|nr:ABC transporter permease subunit [Microbacterium sp. ACRRU]MCG7416146.1 ABC transporter permease subunit [Microbacterium sp. ACRRU]
MRTGPPVFALALATLVAAAVAAPLVQLVVRVGSGDVGAVAAVVFRSRTMDLLIATVGIAFATAAGALALGVATAWALVRVRLPARALWRVVACAPMALPSYVAAFGWISAVPGLSGVGPLVVLLVLVTAPYVTVPTMVAFARMDASITDAARTLGSSPARAFVVGTLPQVIPAALAGTLLAALYALSDFGAPALLRVDTLTTGIYAQFTGGFDRALSAALGLVLALLGAVCVAAESGARRRAGARAGASTAPPAPLVLSRAATVGVLAALTLIGAAAVLVPLGALVARAPMAGRYAATAQELGDAAMSTLALGVGAAVLTVLAALPVAWLGARHRTRLVRVLETVSSMGHALPGLVAALALVALTLAVAPGAYQGAGALVAAYAVLFLPKAIVSSRAAFAGVPPSLEDAARTLGDGPFVAWCRVTLSSAGPGILAGGVLVMAAVMKELPATLLLRPIGVDTLATELWSATSAGAYGAAAWPALLLVAVGLVPALAMARGIRSLGEADR